MKLRIQKRLAGQVLGCSPKKIRFDPVKLENVKEAITKVDVKGLLKNKIITKVKVKSTSRSRARLRHLQKKKGRQRGVGSRKGTANARLSRKKQWINKIRSQRELLKAMVNNSLISNTTYRLLYNRAKGGFFRNKRHIKLYIDENKLVIK